MAHLLSPSSRRAWVEILPDRKRPADRHQVALLAEGVGRNSSWMMPCSRSDVALLAEGVGRNNWLNIGKQLVTVALLAEGVGRNQATERRAALKMRSPSSRRAWVEIFRMRSGVGITGMSPSSRRAWVEIRSGSPSLRIPYVALLAEGVGRNVVPLLEFRAASRRPPRGGRG